MFQLDDTAATPQRGRATARAGDRSGIEALLALQAVEDPLLARRRAVRRGSALLDALAAAQADLLTGAGRRGAAQPDDGARHPGARRRSIPALDALIDDIELRVRVELAKRGRFPA